MEGNHTNGSNKTREFRVSKEIPAIRRMGSDGNSSTHLPRAGTATPGRAVAATITINNNHISHRPEQRRRVELSLGLQLHVQLHVPRCGRLQRKVEATRLLVAQVVDALLGHSERSRRPVAGRHRFSAVGAAW